MIKWKTFIYYLPGGYGNTAPCETNWSVSIRFSSLVPVNTKETISYMKFKWILSFIINYHISLSKLCHIYFQFHLFSFTS